VNGRIGTAVAILAVCLTLPAAADRATAQEPVPPRSAASAVEDSVLEARTTDVASTLRCPVCQGESIQDSPSELAQDMRAVVREQLRDGKTPEEIKAYFVSKYGEWILLEPTMTGLNVLLYVFPVFLVLGGLAIVVFLVRRWTAAPQTTEQP
jgi:cytochrome c-type biogenesis protein CcmH